MENGSEENLEKIDSGMAGVDSLVSVDGYSVCSVSVLNGDPGTCNMEVGDQTGGRIVQESGRDEIRKEGGQEREMIPGDTQDLEQTIGNNGGKNVSDYASISRFIVVKDGVSGVDADSSAPAAVKDGVTSDVGEEVSKSINDGASQTWKVPDGGWGWVIVVSALVVGLIVDGLSYTFGVLMGDLERAFDQPKSTVALASSLQVGIYLAAGPVVSILTNRFGCRSMIIAGSFVAGLAFIASAWSSDVTMLILTYGVGGGIGFGLMYLPSIVAVSIYFEERRAVATGIAVCGSGIGTFIMAPVIDFFVSEFNWRGTLLILGGIVLNGMVFGALVRPLSLHREPSARDSPEDKDEIKASDSSGKSKRGFVEETVQLVTETTNGKRLSQLSNGGPAREEVPLITVTDVQDKLTVVVSRGSGNIENRTTESKSGQPRSYLFSSAPDMNFRSSYQSSRVDPDKINPTSASSFSLTKPGIPPRRRTQSSSDRADLASAPRVHARVPLGLALISLSDANLNQIRQDVHVPLPRKDIHLSGPLAIPDPGSRSISGNQGRGLYIQSIKSITNLAALEGLELVEEMPSGLWSCLPQSARETMEEMLNLTILKEKSYWCVLLGNFFAMVGFYVPFVYIPDRAQQLGIPEEQAALLISIIGITNTIGRVMAGVLINFLNLDSAVVTSIALAIAGVVTALCPLCHVYPLLAAASAIFGVCVGAYISLCSVLLCELLGVERLTNAFGFVILFRGVACMMGPPIAGAIIDVTGVFDPSFYVAGGMIALGGLSHAVLLTPCSRRRKFKS